MPAVQRYLLRIEYDGGNFFGWQRQDNVPTLQGTLESAATSLNGQPVTVQGAGRTDAGVHATGQAAQIDIRANIDPRKVADALNFHLRPHPIAVLSAQPVSEHFQARFDAVARHYLYVIANRRADLALQKGQAWRVPARLDAGRMHRAAQHFLGLHDFSTFRDAQCQANSPLRTVDRVDITRHGDRIEARLSARSFLHRQVRSMIGSLVEVGRGQRPDDWIAEILNAKRREACGPVAPAEGLFLTGVDYPEIALQMDRPADIRFALTGEDNGKD